MAAVTLRIDQVSQTSGGVFNVEFSILVGGVVWQPNQMVSGTTTVELNANAQAVAANLVSVEKERQKMHVGDIITTPLTLTLV